MLEVLHRNAAVASFLKSDPIGSARTGATPNTVIHRQGKSAVRWFHPSVPATAAPVVIVMPLINTWTVWDLLPGRSVVERLLEAGVPVYLVDWGRPGKEDAARPLSDYADVLLGRVFDRVRRHAASQAYPQGLDAIGYCVGGTFLAVHLALHPEQVGRAAFVCTPIDFHQSGRLATWASPSDFPLDAIVDNLGNYPADMMRSSFRWLRPSGVTRKWVSLWEHAEDPAFQQLWAALEQWNDDNVDFPGETYREYVRRCYFDNALVAGGWQVGNRPVSLANVKVPALSIAAAQDHIVPPPAAHALASCWGGPVETVTINGGHVGVSVGRKLPATLIAWLRA
jgi:polyhydroxyalkanoate synthase